jgi:NitT/TauT family transport system permease protein
VLGSRVVLGGGAVLLAIVLWQVAGGTGLVSRATIGSPTGALSAGWDMWDAGELGPAIVDSLQAFFAGMAISVAVGVPLGLVMGWSSFARRSVEPLITALYVTPYLALVPLMLVIFGIGQKLTIAVAVLAAVVPIVINAIAGINSVDPVLIRVGRSFGATRLQLFRRVLMPASMPSIATGIRLGIGRAVMGVIVAEMLVTVGGLGQLVILYGSTYRVDHVMFLVFLISVFGFAMSMLMAQVEARLSGWRSA